MLSIFQIIDIKETQKTWKFRDKDDKSQEAHFFSHRSYFTGVKIWKYWIVLFLF